MKCEFCEVEHSVAVPCVHLNGSPAENLRDDLQAACEAVRDAIAKVVAAAPNGRDYYVYSSPQNCIASNEHRYRCTDLSRTLSELEQMRDHVQTVMDFREAERARRRKA